MTTTERVETSALRSPIDRRRVAVAGAAAGLLAGALTLAVADVVAGVVSPQATPILAVGGTFIDLTPGWLKDLAISTFGTKDKLALLVSMGAVLTLLSVVAGMLAMRRPRLGSASVVALGAVAGAAAITRPGAGPVDLIPTALGVAAGVLALSLLISRFTSTSNAGSPTPITSRRTVLTVVGIGGAAVAAGVSGRALAARTAPGSSPAAVRLPAPRDPAPPLPEGATLDAELAGTRFTPFRTPNADFYRIDTALTVPRVDASTWRLRVHGMVEREIEMSFADLLAAPLVERWITMTCVSNEVGGPLAGNALWRGLPIRTLLERARPAAGADMVLSTSADGWTASTPLDVLTDDRDALLAVGMNGEALPSAHGFPARLVVPGLYGYVSATKWVVDLEVTRFDKAEGYWTSRGWSAQAPIRTASRIDVPRPLSQVKAGRVTVAGVAWAQHRGVDNVEVRVDGGEWQQARLAKGASVDTWAQWTWSWDATPGGHTLQVRATDAQMATQPQERRPPKPDGSTGWHSVVVKVA